MRYSDCSAQAPFGGLVSRFAGEHFGRHVAGVTGNGLGRELLQPGDAHYSEIDQLQGSRALKNHVVRFDVAMDDAGAVERRRRPCLSFMPACQSSPGLAIGYGTTAQG